MEDDLIWIAQFGEVSVTRMESGKWWAHTSIITPALGATVKVRAESDHARPSDAARQLRERVEAVVGTSNQFRQQLLAAREATP